MSLQYKLEKFAKEGLENKDTPWTKQDRLVKWKNLTYIPNDTKLHEDIMITQSLDILISSKHVI